MKASEVRRKSSPRYETPYSQQLGIQRYGKENLYPQDIHNIIMASAVGSECLDRYAEFIEGDGFADVAFSQMVMNRRGETADALHSLICHDLAEFGGFALHVNYNILGQIVELQHVPFESTRLDEPDDNGYVGYIMLHPDWSGRLSRKGNIVKVDRKHCEHVNRFNPNREVVMSQIESVGGIENYKGQILWFSQNGDMVYPTPRADRVITEMSADEGLSNVKWRNVRNNFLPAGILFSKKGQSTPFIPGAKDDRPSRHDEEDNFAESLVSLQGDTNACKLLEVSLESDEDKPEFVKLAADNYDKEFQVTEESVTSRIYSAFGQEPWYCIRIGKLGFSGDVLTDAYDYYNSVVSKQRRQIERAFQTLMSKWYEPLTTTDFSTMPLTHITTPKA